MEFRHLRYFLVLAEELHFGRAAQRLAISQPPLSLNIQQLEASVGARLFTRNSRGVQLTEAGLAFVPAARGLLEHAQAAARQARDVGPGPGGHACVSASRAPCCTGACRRSWRRFARTSAACAWCCAN
jgi:DNA-binding transcriptional LysR family regulator